MWLVCQSKMQQSSCACSKIRGFRIRCTAQCSFLRVCYKHGYQAWIQTLNGKDQIGCSISLLQWWSNKESCIMAASESENHLRVGRKRHLSTAPCKVSSPFTVWNPKKLLQRSGYFIFWSWTIMKKDEICWIANCFVVSCLYVELQTKVMVNINSTWHTGQ